ncbi:OmpA family protein [Muricoccus radiodurans]|uniref:OmpA family protein n=1 Tax=Muricoccus radiodurans TaxID=2231721 RepID=UPI003CF81F8B
MRPLLAAFAALPILAACVSGDDLANRPPAVVFFTDSSALLDGPARAVVADTAALANRNPNVPVVVTGYADPLGPTPMNNAISAARAEAVAGELRQGGVAPQRIVTRAAGEVPPPGNLPYPSRRAEIRVGP